MSKPIRLPARTLIITRGVPGCGKTSWATAWRDALPDIRVRVNRDDTRKMLFGGWTGKPEDEQLVIEVTTRAIVQALRNGRQVVADDTWTQEFHIWRIHQICTSFRTRLFVKAFDTSLEECIKRDKERDVNDYVGEDVIRQKWKELQEYPNEQLIVAGIPEYDGDLISREVFPGQ